MGFTHPVEERGERGVVATAAAVLEGAVVIVIGVRPRIAWGDIRDLRPGERGQRQHRQQDRSAPALRRTAHLEFGAKRRGSVVGPLKLPYATAVAPAPAYLLSFAAVCALHPYTARQARKVTCVGNVTNGPLVQYYKYKSLCFASEWWPMASAGIHARLTDEQLVTAMRSGCLEAFEVLVERYHAPLLHYLLRQTGDAELAADLAQDTFLDAAASRPAGRRPSLRRMALPDRAEPPADGAAAAALHRLVSLDWLPGRTGAALPALCRSDEDAPCHERDAIQQVLDELSPPCARRCC